MTRRADPPGERRTTGTVPGRELRRARPAGRPPDRVLIVGFAFVGIIALLWLLAGAPTRPGTVGPGSPTPAATDGAAPTVGASEPPVATAAGSRPEPTASSGVPAASSAVPTASPTDPPSPDDTTPPSAPPEATPEPSPEPAPTRSVPPEPTPPRPTDLVIFYPDDGAVVSSSTVDVAGGAPPGSTITRDVAWWFDDHVVTADDGAWRMRVELAEGENVLTFRIGDDLASARTITVRYVPPG